MNSKTWFIGWLAILLMIIVMIENYQLNKALKSSYTCERLGLTVKSSSYDVKSQVIRIECEVK